MFQAKEKLELIYLTRIYTPTMDNVYTQVSSGLISERDESPRQDSQPKKVIYTSSQAALPDWSVQILHVKLYDYGKICMMISDFAETCFFFAPCNFMCKMDTTTVIYMVKCNN